MRVLFFCDTAGSFGNASRIWKVYEYIKSINDNIAFCNLYPRHNSWLKCLASPSLVSSAVKNSLTRDQAFMKSEAFIALGKDVLTKSVRRHRPDLIFAEETRTAYVATLNREKIPVVADLHGLVSAEYAECPETRISNRHFARLEEIEAEVCEKASRILVVSYNMKRFLERVYGTDTLKVSVVQNGSDLHSERAHYAEPMKMVFGGCFNYWEDVDAYLDMSKSDSHNAYFLLGTGPRRRHILTRIRNENISMNYMGTRNRNNTLDLFCDMTIGVAPSTQNLTREVASPVKIYDYMACGLPVITPKYGEWAEHVGENDCGIVTESSSGDAFLDAARRLQDRDMWEQMANNCRLAIRTKYNWGKVLSPISEII